MKVKLKKTVVLYKDVAGKRAIKKIKASKTLKIKAIKWTKKGTPRLQTTDGNYITASKKYVKLVK
jgi:hypothetical protein